jgi:hypothetical protein
MPWNTAVAFVCRHALLLNKRLLAERDILKKALAFFAKEATGSAPSARSTRRPGP